jgi:hypothetical protein
MTNTTTGDYEIGFGKPPKATQYKKGQSGNPGGRKPGSRSHSEIINKAMNEKVTVTVKGRQRTMTMMELAFTQQSKKAAEGDRHAMKLMMELLYQANDRDAASQVGSPMSAEERKAGDQAILAILRDQAKTLTTETDHDG